MGYDLEKKTTGSVHSVSSDREAGGMDGGDLRAERPSQGSSYQAFFNIVCVVAGTGTLGLPFCLAQGIYCSIHESGYKNKYFVRGMFCLFTCVRY